MKISLTFLLSLTFLFLLSGCSDSGDELEVKNDEPGDELEACDNCGVKDIDEQKLSQDYRKVWWEKA